MFIKKLISLLIFTGIASLNAGEKFESSGFSAEIGKTGIIRQLSWNGVPLAQKISLVGEYERQADEKKYDAHFYHEWDNTGSAQFQREGESLIISNKSQIGNSAFKDGISYTIRCVMEPSKISYDCELLQNVPLKTHLTIFDIQIAMQASLFGCGAKEVSSYGNPSYKIIPDTYNSKFRMEGSEISISTQEGIFTIRAGDDTSLTYVDTRAWGGKNFIISAFPSVIWSKAPIIYPAGKTWKWKFTIEFIPRKK